MNLIENVEDLIKGATTVSLDEFLELANAVVELQANEHGRVGSLQITGRLVSLMPEGEVVIIGDIHGDVESLFHILKATDIIQRLRNVNSAFWFFSEIMETEGSARLRFITLC